MTESPRTFTYGQIEYTIAPENVRQPDVQALVEEHLQEMVAMSAPETSFALSADQLAVPYITLFVIRRGAELLGCGALKELDAQTGELKTMRTVAHARGLGIGGLMLDHLIDVACRRGYTRVYLETGSEDHFGPARAMYAGRGFRHCGPFGDYKVDPHSVFMVVDLPHASIAPQ